MKEYLVGGVKKKGAEHGTTPTYRWRCQAPIARYSNTRYLLRSYMVMLVRLIACA
jgi:hypothetical protein